jgi:uracil-DNA glycosylase family 4
LEKRTEKLIGDLEERVKFFSQMGIDFIDLSTGPEEPSSHSFQSLKEQILDCQKCPLAQERRNAVPGEGSLETDLMFVGEAPGRDEDVQGRPFVGRAGQLLTKIIKAMHFEREEVYITNVVKCRPPKNRTPHVDEIEKCKGYLLDQIEMIRPRVIVTLGKVATDFFVRSRLGMSALRGKFYDYGDIQVMPTFHPSYLIRNEPNKILKKMVWEDMKKVMAFLGKE